MGSDGGPVDSPDFRVAARAGEFDAVWWEYDRARDGSVEEGIHIVVEGEERVLTEKSARNLADRLEREMSTKDSVAMVSDLRESADALERVRGLDTA